MAVSRRILVVEHNRELGRLYQATLQDEGFDVDLEVAPDDVVVAVRGHDHPDLLILDLPPPTEAALEVLDALRTDDVARDVEVITLTTQDAVAEVAMASYNVVASFTKPFDLDGFVDAVQRHTQQPSLLADVRRERPHAGDVLDHAEHILAERSRHIVFRWVQRIRTSPPWSDRPDLTLEDLIDYAPVVLQLIDVRLHYDSHEEFFRRHPEALERAKGHARVRKAQNIGVVSAVEEYTFLREELWRELAERFPEDAGTHGAFAVERAINRTVDTVIVATLRAYMGQVSV